MKIKTTAIIATTLLTGLLTSNAAFAGEYKAPRFVKDVSFAELQKALLRAPTYGNQYELFKEAKTKKDLLYAELFPDVEE